MWLEYFTANHISVAFYVKKVDIIYAWQPANKTQSGPVTYILVGVFCAAG